MTRDNFRRALLKLWTEAHEIHDASEARDFVAWSGATKDLLLEMGMQWSVDTRMRGQSDQNYRF